MKLAAALTLVVGLVGCGGDGEKAAPVAWCNNTGLLIYLLDQHSTTMDAEALREWETAPENVRPAAAQMGAALRRYPVDANASDLVAARNEIEVYAKGSCQDDWEGPHPYSG